MMSLVYRLTDGGFDEVKENRARALEEFMRSRELRALRMAELATGNRDDALELVQDAMFGLARNYGTRPEAEWGPLFHRILHSRITDWRRRSALRRRWFAVFRQEEDAPRPEDLAPAPRHTEPDAAVSREQSHDRVMAELASLPRRQQQAFLLRAWEGLDTREAAYAMGCSEGSVKTHFHRAVQRLRAATGGDDDA